MDGKIFRILYCPYPKNSISRLPGVFVREILSIFEFNKATAFLTNTFQGISWISASLAIPNILLRKSIGTLRRSLPSNIIFESLRFRLRNVIANKSEKWSSTHERKLKILYTADNKHVVKRFSPNFIHNFSSYVLSPCEKEALSYNLDYAIPSKHHTRKLETEFEKYHPAHRNNNRNICVLKQDKERGVVIIDRTNYIEKCEKLLIPEKFKMLRSDVTSKLEGQVQRALRKIKPCLTVSEYKKLCPQGSSPAQFYGTAKVRKIPPNPTVADDLPLQPIISNIGSATYNTSKYLAKLLTPLTQSTYTTESSLDFISSLKGEKIPHNYKLLSFDVTSLITNLYIQADGVAMGSPLGTVLANIFMFELENEIVPKLENSVKFWKHYVDDTICFVNEKQINNVLVTLNSYHSNIQCTYEVENDNYIAFHDVKVKFI
ncbi:uncharacterized protein LOC130621404 [Hydractinia symbiolongicarpus]|uniref:uncharacterized protein LOC130621404 n=1 Tax=Hydractinia symbiolongicarpus TaxID=13093 RepID=UPI00254DAFAA|nr:uncharacterized protein LOC130621404 [Hydractinia symbiolongicarpus]